MKTDKAVVLAAGRGTRMRELTAGLPKPMIEVRGKPVLQHIVEGLRDAGVRQFLIIVGYRADAVQNFFGDGSRYNINIQYATQVVQDGTGRVVDLREKSKPGDAERWSALSERAVPWYNAGIYTFRPSIFEFTAKLKPSPRGEYELTDAIRDLVQSGKKVKALELTGEWADVRDPEILARLNQE